MANSSNALKRTTGSESKKAAQHRQPTQGETSFSAHPRKAPPLVPISKDGAVHKVPSKSVR